MWPIQKSPNGWYSYKPQISPNGFPEPEPATFHRWVAYIYCLWPESCSGGMLFINPWVIWLFWVNINIACGDSYSAAMFTYLNLAPRLAMICRFCSLIQHPHVFWYNFLWKPWFGRYFCVICCSLEKYRPTWANSMEFCCKDFLELHVRQGFRALSQ